MQTNSVYPFNQKQHIFDFKVKVNFQNGNVSLTAPQIVNPPALFNSTNQQMTMQINNQPNSNSTNKQNVFYSGEHQLMNIKPGYMNNNLNNNANQIQASTNTYQPISHINKNTSNNHQSQPLCQPIKQPPLNNPANEYLTPVKHPYTPSSNNSSLILPNQQIQLVNSSYTSFKQTDFPINNSMEMIECVICQKSFSINEFDDHLSIHKNRNVMMAINNFNNNQGNNNLSTQKVNSNTNRNISNQNMHTQNSFNTGNESSYMSEEQPRSGQYSFNNNNQNSSYLSNNNSCKNSSDISKQGKLSLSKQKQHNKSSINIEQKQPVSNNNDSSFHLLGRIDNPILAINAAQQTSLNQSYQSSQIQNSHSLNYSNSSGQQITTRFPDPHAMFVQNPLMPIHPAINNPLNNQINHPHIIHNNSHSSSSFGQHPGLNNSHSHNIIGPSFYQNNVSKGSSFQNQISLGNHNFVTSNTNEMDNQQINRNKSSFTKGVNRLAYYQQNNGIENRSGGVIIGEQYSNNSRNFSNHNNQSRNQNYTDRQQQQLQNASYCSNQSSNVSYHSNNGQRSNHSLQGVQGGYHQNNSPVAIIMENFQPIESRYLTNQQGYFQQPQLYHSHHDINRGQKVSLNNIDPRSQQKIFQLYQDDISSISRTSRVDMSRDSDFSSFQNQYNQDLKLQGYNSADNSLMKNMQKRDNKQNQNSKQQKFDNIYLDRERDRKSQNNRNGKTAEQEEFFKKKKDHMISSATSYYQKRFKGQDLSSSDQQCKINGYKTGRLSYAQRLKQKRTTDIQVQSNHNPSNHKQSNRNSKTLKNSSKKQLNGSKYSESSQLSKTKLPVNYLARQQFISTSSNNTKSTHKSTNAN